MRRHHTANKSGAPAVRARLPAARTRCAAARRAAASAWSGQSLGKERQPVHCNQLGSVFWLASSSYFAVFSPKTLDLSCQRLSKSRMQKAVR